MDIVTEAWFWKSVEDKKISMNNLKYLFKSLSELEEICTNNDKCSGKINFVDDWYFQWDIIEDKILVSNLHRCQD